MSARPELGEFLQTRRARVRPEDVGLRPGADRRVAGLRREEVALLASVSVDYYVRLEQGRAGNPSVAVLNAVADALRMSQAERDHLRTLACSAPPAVPPKPTVRPQLQAMIHAMRELPAIVVDRMSNVLAWNDAATAVITNFEDPSRRNLARLYFLDDDSRTYYADWTTVAQDAVALLRRASAEYADDTELQSLVTELRAASPDFNRFWTSQDVQNRSHCPKTLNHPTAGELTFTIESLQLPGDPDQHVLTYTPATPPTAAWLNLRTAVSNPHETFTS
ncbi:helix-turn-helix transcriptional regulator [Kribbella solani]|uniref:helix-turn-helix transcriptional regulator n=2 Tax=Kribbella solani TaxID=236067 RepID=UPI0029B1077B|nr:helix-turn-helix transcriptional regulator [Kribbella solani]MDX3005751.1 helix-turn-helix transcriptional regulator [Kribbella solani]